MAWRVRVEWLLGRPRGEGFWRVFVAQDSVAVDEHDAAAEIPAGRERDLGDHAEHQGQGADLTMVVAGALREPGAGEHRVAVIIVTRWIVAVFRAGVPGVRSSQSSSPVMAVGAASSSPPEMASSAPWAISLCCSPSAPAISIATPTV